jgi:hypothetical protein
MGTGLVSSPSKRIGGILNGIFPVRTDEPGVTSDSTATSLECGAGSELFPGDENSEFIRYVPRQSTGGIVV